MQRPGEGCASSFSSMIRVSCLHAASPPPDVIDIFKDIYDDSSVCMSLNKSITSSIAIGRRVFQGDPCSPPLKHLFQHINAILIATKKN